VREQEENPPMWLTKAVGRRPARTKSDSAIDPAARRSYQRAERAIADAVEARERRKELAANVDPGFRLEPAALGPPCAQ
jgi:hypothetical protein